MRKVPSEGDTRGCFYFCLNFVDECFTAECLKIYSSSCDYDGKKKICLAVFLHINVVVEKIIISFI